MILTYKQIPYLGLATRSYNNQPKKRTCKIVDFAVLVGPSKIERKWKEGQVPWPCLWKWRLYQL